MAGQVLLERIPTSQQIRFLGEAGNITDTQLVPDLNSDGWPGIIIGAANVDEEPNGRVYVLFGGPDALPGGATIDLAEFADSPGAGGFVVVGDDAERRLGVRAGPVGDVNGDGTGDFAFTSQNDEVFGSQSGALHVVFGGATLNGFERLDVSDLTDGRLGFVIIGDDPFGVLGLFNFAGAGHVNGDGMEDLLVKEARAPSDVADTCSQR